jgi:hypothetical protein
MNAALLFSVSGSEWMTGFFGIQSGPIRMPEEGKSTGMQGRKIYNALMDNSANGSLSSGYGIRHLPL